MAGVSETRVGESTEESKTERRDSASTLGSLVPPVGAPILSGILSLSNIMRLRQQGTGSITLTRGTAASKES